MPRPALASIGCFVLLALPEITWTQSPAPDPTPESKPDGQARPDAPTRLDALTQEVTQLKSKVADQDRRIADLEKSVKALQAAAPPLPQALPSETPAWHQPSNWNLIKLGMSEAQVVDALGPPTRVQSVEDTRTLYYQPDPRSAVTLQGSITLLDDRVTAVSPPAF